LSDDRIAREFLALARESTPVVFESAKFSSPGVWEFLGGLNPLNFVLELIKLWRVSSEGRRYRNSHEQKVAQLEEQRLFLQNQLLSNQIVRERLDILRQVGVSEPVIQENILGPMISSLVELTTAADQQAIDPSKSVVKRIDA
jgi:hypothetical protein